MKRLLLLAIALTLIAPGPALGRGGTYGPKSPVTAAFMVGELQRQLGRFAVAKAHFAKLCGVAAFNAQPYKRMIRYEMQLIAKKDSATHAIPTAKAKSGTKKTP